MSSRAHRVSLGDAASGRPVHPDLDCERRGPAFDVERLTHLLDGGARNTARRRDVERLFRDDPVFNLIASHFMSQDERREAALQRRVQLHKMARRLGWRQGGPEFHYASRAISGDITWSVHDVAMQTIRSLGSDEQIARWVPLCEACRIVMTYAQTEMGHGTYVQGLETEATYDEAAQEFVIHSPTVTATKWWPGDLGHWATHAIVMAQLICSGARQGIHPFIVPIRSLQDHSPLPGITVGTIGPTLGLDITDNGFLQLDRVRVPRENMLSRFAQVLPDGTYIRFGTAQSNYLSMVVTRVTMLEGMVQQLQKACVITTRYSVVRRQSRLRPGDPEAKVLDYQTQQQKVFVPLAMSYAFHFQLVSLLDFFHHSYEAIRSKDTSLLPELHALSTGAKATMTDLCTQGAEVCRRACGGHGYSRLSNLPFLVSFLTASCTFEGENTVLYLQLGRFLVKSYQRARGAQKDLPPSVSYLAEPSPAQCPAQKAADFLCPEIYIMAWAHVATRLIEDCVRHLQTLTQAGADQQEAWNQTGVSLVQAAKVHYYYLTVKSFKEALEKLDHEPAIQRVLKRLCDLFALHGIVTEAGNFVYDGFLSSSQVDMARASYLGLLPLIRKDAVLLTDAFDFTDKTLNSALGCYDGNVYERLFHWAQMSPSNNSQENSTYEKHIRPLIQSQGSKL